MRHSLFLCSPVGRHSHDTPRVLLDKVEQPVELKGALVKKSPGAILLLFVGLRLLIYPGWFLANSSYCLCFGSWSLEVKTSSP